MGTTKCELCGDSGWAQVPVVGGVEAYARCGCQKPRGDRDHKGGCSCLNCHYGDRAEDIRAGVDGLRGPPDVDQLRELPTRLYDQGAF